MQTPAEYQPPNLKDRVALVAGATRGVGRGIALALGEAGATVYCTGRSTKANRIPRPAGKKISPFDHAHRPETIDETAAMVIMRGGKGIAVAVDHTDPVQVKDLVQKIRSEQGKLHILVNDISELTHADFGKLFWQLDLQKGFANLDNVVHTHVTTSHFAAPLLIETAANGGPTGLFLSTCQTPTGTATALLTDQNGDKTVNAGSSFTVSGCPGTGGTPSASSASGVSVGGTTLSNGGFSGLGTSHPTLRFKLHVAKHAPKIRSLTVALPRGLRFRSHPGGARSGVMLTGGSGQVARATASSES